MRWSYQNLSAIKEGTPAKRGNLLLQGCVMKRAQLATKLMFRIVY